MTLEIILLICSIINLGTFIYLVITHFKFEKKIDEVTKELKELKEIKEKEKE